MRRGRRRYTRGNIMHPHFFLIGAILHATLVAVIAFFILYAAGKASGFTKTLGSVLGIWVLIIAAVILAGGVTAAVNGGKPFGMEPMWGHHGGKHCDADKDDAAAPVMPTPVTPPKK
jgi:hypothetical protein